MRQGRRECTTLLRRCHAPQSGVTAILIVEGLVVLELQLEIALVPKPDPIEILTTDGSDQSLDERMRTGCSGNGLELVDFKHPQVGLPALKAEQRIVV
jgi:hypothetical protein